MKVAAKTIKIVLAAATIVKRINLRLASEVVK